MSGALPYIAVALTAAGTYQSFKSQSEAAAAQKDAARESARLAEINARNQERETQVEVANLSEAQAKAEAMNRAKAAASGVAVAPGGSYALTLAEQKKYNTRELEWLKESGASRANIIRQQGQSSMRTGMAQADATKSGAYGSLWSGLGSAASDTYTIGKS